MTQTIVWNYFGKKLRLQEIKVSASRVEFKNP